MPKKLAVPLPRKLTFALPRANSVETNPGMFAQVPWDRPSILAALAHGGWFNGQSLSEYRFAPGAQAFAIAAQFTRNLLLGSGQLV